MQATKNKSQAVYTLLENIKKHAGFYLSSVTLVCLSDFLNGFKVGQNSDRYEIDGEPPFNDFAAWFCIHHNAPGAAAGGWRLAIEDQSTDEKQAFSLFFEYLAAYRKRRPALQYYFTLSAAQRKICAKSERTPVPDRLCLTRYKGEHCVFFHVGRSGQRGWSMHGGFKSLTSARWHLRKWFGVTDTQWRKAKKDASVLAAKPK